MSIKKAFQDVVALLEENKNSKVKTILPAVIELCSAKSGGAGGEPTFLRNEAGGVAYIFCYYHKTWEPVNTDGSADDGVCEYGAKATSATGLSNMCKEGTSAWTKQQREAKKANENLLKDVAAGEVAPADILEVQAGIEAIRKEVTTREDGLGTSDKPA